MPVSDSSHGRREKPVRAIQNYFPLSKLERRPDSKRHQIWSPEVFISLQLDYCKPPPELQRRRGQWGVTLGLGVPPWSGFTCRGHLGCSSQRGGSPPACPTPAVATEVAHTSCTDSRGAAQLEKDAGEPASQETTRASFQRKQKSHLFPQKSSWKKIAQWCGKSPRYKSRRERGPGLRPPGTAADKARGRGILPSWLGPLDFSLPKEEAKPALQKSPASFLPLHAANPPAPPRGRSLDLACLMSPR